jgi:hypothetical protein
VSGKKSSFKLDHTPSAHPNIIKSLFLAHLIATAVTFTSISLALVKKSLTSSLQRLGLAVHYLKSEMLEAVTRACKRNLDRLFNKIEFFEREFYDPNRSRASSLQKLETLAGCGS